LNRYDKEKLMEIAHVFVQILKEVDGTVTPRESAVFYDDTNDDELSTYKSGNKHIDDILKEATTTMNTLPFDVRDEENEIFTEATVTSPPLTTVINGFILPLTVRNFFKRPTFNPIQDNGIETVRTSEKKNIGNVLEKGTTQVENITVFGNNSETDLTTESVGDKTTEYFFNMPTTQPIKLPMEEHTESSKIKGDDEEILKQIEELSSMTKSDSKEKTNTPETFMENTVPSTIFESFIAYKNVSSESSIDTTTLSSEVGNTTELLFSNKIEEINIARDAINRTETSTTTNNNEQSLQELFTTESAEGSTAEAKIDSGMLSKDSDEAIASTAKIDEAVSDRMENKKEEKRPPSTSPVSDLLNGIYRLISVKNFFI